MAVQDAKSDKSLISNLSEKYGFLACGFARAEKLHQTEPFLQDWLNRGYQGNMTYIENHFSKRLDPTLLVENAKTVICFAYNYFPKPFDPTSQSQDVGTTAKIAKYAWGRDNLFDRGRNFKVHSTKLFITSFQWGLSCFALPSSSTSNSTSSSPPNP